MEAERKLLLAFERDEHIRKTKEQTRESLLFGFLRSLRIANWVYLLTAAGTAMLLPWSCAENETICLRVLYGTPATGMERPFTNNNGV